MEDRARLVPALQPVLNIEHKDEWEPVGEKGTNCVIWFLFKGEKEYRVGIDYYSEGEEFGVWIYTVSFEQYSSLDNAVEKLKEYMEEVEQKYYFDQIAGMRGEGRYYRDKLVDLPGIGEKMITRLVDKFTCVKGVKSATMEELEKVNGIGKERAWQIAGFLHENIRYHYLWNSENEEWTPLYQIPDEIKEKHVRMQRKISQEEKEKYKLSRKEIKERNLRKRR